MYFEDVKTGETVFVTRPQAEPHQVDLEYFSERGHLQVSMHRSDANWETRLPLGPGWFFYRFRVDGQARYDRSSGKLKTEDGESWSLALIAGRRDRTNPPRP